MKIIVKHNLHAPVSVPIYGIYVKKIQWISVGSLKREHETGGYMNTLMSPAMV